jgi:5-methylcytosine-specific restriction endonuclease McrA
MFGILSRKEKQKERLRKWREEHPNYNREYQKNNWESILKKNRKYIAAHPEKNVLAVENYRAKKKKNGGRITSEEWGALKAKCDYMCLCCKRREPEIKLELDHVLPIALGGTNTIDNAQPLCRSCNARKNNKHIDYRPF